MTARTSGPRAGKSLFLAALAGTAITDGYRPVVEQVAANRDLVTAVMVQFGVVGLLCPVLDNAEQAPAGSRCPGPARVTAAHNRITALPGST